MLKRIWVIYRFGHKIAEQLLAANNNEIHAVLAFFEERIKHSPCSCGRGSRNNSVDRRNGRT